MNLLRASWLGSWRSPWNLDRGRRWGDKSWTLMALAQAWLLGGREGRWPQIAWQAKRPVGPWPVGTPETWTPRPDHALVALLRHGTAKAHAEHPGSHEEPLETHAWEALLAGDGMPWMALGTLFLDRATRSRWIALLGAVDDTGRLHLPPFLEILIPETLRTLPPGWWECLLSTMDASGRLLPQGVPDPELPWKELLGSELMVPLLLDEIPTCLSAFADTGLLHHLNDGRWMLDPRIRAWVRAQGAHPAALEALVSRGLAMGDDPDARLAAILNGALPTDARWLASWNAPLKQDLSLGPRPSDVPACGDPSLDRLRVRWGGEPPEPSEGYPPWGTRHHPCADPFHWMAEGMLNYTVDVEHTLLAFALAHAHFKRLGSLLWARRAAANAAKIAVYWGDPDLLAHWQAAQGPQPSPYREMDEAIVLAIRGEWDAASERMRQASRIDPTLEQPWIFLGERALGEDRADWAREALEHISHPDVRAILEAFLHGFAEPCPEAMLPELAVLWRFYRAKRGLEPSKDFWDSWETCLNHTIRLETGLRLMEAFPTERIVRHLLDVQMLAQRSGNQDMLARVKRLWPTGQERVPEDPARLITRWLSQRNHPAWVFAGDHMLPTDVAPPPEGMVARLRAEGSLPACEWDGRLWWGFPLHWQDRVVGSALVSLEPSAALDSCADLTMLAPWAATLAPQEPHRLDPHEGDLLCDGSEPMRSVIQEVARVAPSGLAVLILGPTGSGKELVARELHQRSGRPGPLIPVNCSAFAESLLESELFGHVKGAFTGADRTRTGAIEAAHGGTLFLDEVADLSPRLQSLFLRVLQECEVRKVGDHQAVKVDVRFLAATHKNLEELALHGQFRRDLLYRLMGTVLALPALKDRSHEFPFLIPRLVARIATGRGRAVPSMAPGLPQALAHLPWQGNFRELAHAIERALLRCGQEPLSPSHFPELDMPIAKNQTWADATRLFQRGLLLDALRRNDFNASEAAKSLGITRPTLYLAARRSGLDLILERENRARTPESDGVAP